jgi:DNA ligase (NAD+)
MDSIIKSLNKLPFETLEKLNESQLEEITLIAQETFFNSGKPILSDEIYDILIDYFRFKFPKNKVSKNIGAKIKDKERKTKLDYYLGSMDKIKPPSKELDKWKNKYKSPYVLTDKLDGISALLIYTDDSIKMTTRGTATEGLDISNLINYLNLPSIDQVKKICKSNKIKGEKNLLAVRGELIISKNKFNKNWSDKMKNARNTVSGLVNSKTINPNLAIDTDFIAYELVDPNHKILDQFVLLQLFNFKTVEKIIVNDINYELLGSYLIKKRKDSKYVIDGIVVYNNEVHTKSKTGNPKYAFAFKDILDDQKATTEIIDIEWKISKDGYINPVVIIKPVDIGGVNIERVTAYNAKYVVSNKLGKGAKIEIIRSGDVIPKINKVIEVAKTIDMPKVKYHWNDTKVDIIVDKIEGNKEIEIKNIYYFFSKLDTKGLGERVVEKLYEAGLNTVLKILKANANDILKVEGFKDKSTQNLLQSIKKSVSDVELNVIFAASNKLGHGHGRERAKMILDVYPNIMTEYKKWTIDEFIEKIGSIPQWDSKTSKQFVSNFPTFLKFYDQIKSYIKIKQPTTKKKVSSNNSFISNKVFVFTGFRDSSLKEKIESLGGSVKDTLNSKTDYLVVKEKDTGSSKEEKANELKKEIITKDELEKKI